ncbi:hypothetical protein SMACR_05648 [Sordaria macrospora]|uniref:Uncharacterized protein n=1 Tax=Sordaria macrospora TaxID=5147 RepID=A0A8S8ZBI3_SORMA|nr:hypothetical protein SMACR_05648 [Sordaria macrospora]WPJ62480.1 hypothetical protein SMAC4_05648 [Sordaria macrospora]
MMAPRICSAVCSSFAFRAASHSEQLRIQSSFAFRAASHSEQLRISPSSLFRIVLAVIAMKTSGLFALSGAALSGAALLQGVSAACCRSNKCLKGMCSPFHFLPGPNLVTNTIVLGGRPRRRRTRRLFRKPRHHHRDFHRGRNYLHRNETALAETLFYTETVTSTGPVQTETVTRTMTQTLTTTSTELAPGVTSTATNYVEEPSSLKVKARRTDIAAPSGLPEYAPANCADWAKYLKACKCVGVEEPSLLPSRLKP